MEKKLCINLLHFCLEFLVVAIYCCFCLERVGIAILIINLWRKWLLLVLSLFQHCLLALPLFLCF
ncbi:hypothetical protein Gogos_015259 [Gossypium gossypioides]|uniref:Uncharacterized protein n=1 Tax=Gossypium gossypioides TaxID=34282 RepID=A0A7J9C175_GOSGO|nr:hypothetical protein [Gossypium gossypioides]